MPSRSLHVAVIGAGPAGLMAARELRREGHAPVVFERAAGVGGNWRYEGAPADEPLGGAGVHSSLYASLRANLPRECMGFLDFPFVAGTMGSYSEDPRRFPGHEEVLRYLEAFAGRFDLHALVRLETGVVSVRRDGEGAGWKVSYSKKLAGSDSEQEAVEEEVFDAVVVCNGLSEPRLADIAGIEDWPGKQMHSHSYRVPDPFRGQVVVVVGYAPSGHDISRDIAGVAKEVHVARRSPATSETQTTARPNLWIHPMIERAEGDGSVVFQDGSRVKADAILHCSGYKYSYPFLADDDGISVDDNRVGPLYQHVFPPHLAPHISFIGLHMAALFFPVCQLQSNWVAGVLSGRIDLPARGEMMEHVEDFYSKMEVGGLPKRYTHSLGACTALFFPVCQLQSNWVAGVLSGRIDLPSRGEMMEHVEDFYSKMEVGGLPKRYTHSLGACTYEYEDWVADQCGMERIEGWRKEMYATTLKNSAHRTERYMDECEWDDDHLLPQAYQDFAKYS